MDMSFLVYRCRLQWEWLSLCCKTKTIAKDSKGGIIFWKLRITFALMFEDNLEIRREGIQGRIFEECKSCPHSLARLHLRGRGLSIVMHKRRRKRSFLSLRSVSFLSIRKVFVNRFEVIGIGWFVVSLAINNPMQQFPVAVYSKPTSVSLLILNSRKYHSQAGSTTLF